MLYGIILCSTENHTGGAERLRVTRMHDVDAERLMDRNADTDVQKLNRTLNATGAQLRITPAAQSTLRVPRTGHTDRYKIRRVLSWRLHGRRRI